MKKIRINEFYNECRSAVILYVGSGSRLDAGQSGLSHLVEHMLVEHAYDQIEGSMHMFDFYVIAHTTYEYMAFEFRYNEMKVDTEYVIGVVNQVMNARTVDFQNMITCKKDIIMEIKEQSNNHKWLQRIYGNSYEQYVPLGDKSVIERINEQELNDYILNYYLTAPKCCVAIEPNRFKQKYRITVLYGDMWNNQSDGEYESALEYIFDDIIYLNLCDLKKAKMIQNYQFHRAENRKYLEVVTNYNETELINILSDEKKFYRFMRLLGWKYLWVKKFDLSNVCQIVIDGIHRNTRFFQMDDIHKILYWKKHKQYYKPYQNYVEKIGYLLS